MVEVINWNDKKFLNKLVPIHEIKHSLIKNFEDNINLRLLLIREKGDNNVNFLIKPNCEGLKYKKNCLLIKDETLFNIEINVKNLPDVWSGELLIESKGLVKKIPISFEKISNTH